MEREKVSQRFKDEGMTMRVQAAPGLKCPKENDPRQYIGEEPVEVPDTAYYRRMLDDESLVLAPVVGEVETKRGKSEQG